jgi:molecular chaperone GrpE
MPRRKKAEEAEPTAAASAQAEEPEAGAAAPDAEVSELKRQLAEAQERADRYHSNWQRSAADFQNWKRRADQEKGDVSRQAEAALTAELLRVLDDFERAFQSLPPELRPLTWVEGVALIWQKLYAILQTRGLSPIEAMGAEFDPYLHEAVLRDEDTDPSELTSVVAELQRGYRFHDKVLRASLVKIGRPRTDAAAPPQSDDQGSHAGAETAEETSRPRSDG